MVHLGVDKTDCSSVTIGSGKNRACVVYAYGPDGNVIYEEITFYPDFAGVQPAGMVDGGRAYSESLWEGMFGK